MIKVSIKDGYFELQIEDHFWEQSEDRGFKFSQDQLISIVENSFVIKNRPRKKLILLKNNFQEAIYLWNQNKKCIIVLVENQLTHYFNIIKTIYHSSQSNWLIQWQNDTPKENRKKLLEIKLLYLKID